MTSPVNFLAVSKLTSAINGGKNKFLDRLNYTGWALVVLVKNPL